MSTSEQKEGREENASDEYVKALLEDGDEGLKKAFNVLKKGKGGDGARALVKDVDLQRAVSARLPDMMISVEKANEIIQQFNKQGLFSLEEFIYIVKVIKCLKKDGLQGLNEGFDVLSKGRSTVGVEDVQLALTIRHTQPVAQQLTKHASFNFNEFLHVFT